MTDKITIQAWHWNTLSSSQQTQILQRPAIQRSNELRQGVARIIQQVRDQGDNALRELTHQFDGVQLSTLDVPDNLWTAAANPLNSALKQAIKNSAARIRDFHEAAMPDNVKQQTAPGVICETVYRPIRRVGLYVPAGSAPLPSTLLMLAIPAKLAGCAELIVCSPPDQDGQVDAAVLAAASLCGVDKVFAVGGAQAVAAMAYGTDSIPGCDKIYGPGNRWVTEAKQQVSSDPYGAAIDMPAGPSEVLVIADDSANPEWVAADLLSQAEHGPDSQVVLVTTSTVIAEKVNHALQRQLTALPRAEIAAQSILSSFTIIVDDLQTAVSVSNNYAPEHLIIASDNAADLVDGVTAAGSVFVGHYTPESIGDYCSGTNHVLPTAGWARSYGSLSTADFMTRMTVQSATPQGLQIIGPDAITLAEHEQLDAHANAVRLRLAS